MMSARETPALAIQDAVMELSYLKSGQDALSVFSSENTQRTPRLARQEAHAADFSARRLESSPYAMKPRTEKTLKRREAADYIQGCSRQFTGLAVPFGYTEVTPTIGKCVYKIRE
jgi:hypothetical protein